MNDTQGSAVFVHSTTFSVSSYLRSDELVWVQKGSWCGIAVGTHSKLWLCVCAYISRLSFA